MPMYLDSPPVLLKGNKLSVLVPAQRIQKTEFKFDGVVAYMQVNTTNKNLPCLGSIKRTALVQGI